MGILVFIIGTILGSFYLVVGTRAPKGENVITGRSRCDNCQHPLKWYELIPLLSFIWQRGKCNYCHQKIAIEHLLVEILTGSLFLFGYYYFHLTLNFYIYLAITSVAIIIFISDFKYMVILDSPIIIGSILVLLLQYLEGGFQHMGIHLIYGFVLSLIMFLIKLLGDHLFKRESLGGGDIKLAFLIGITLGFPGIGLRMGLISLIFASFLALPYAIANTYLNKKNELPYGPFLIASMIIIFIFSDKFANLLVFFSLL